jgi:2-iminobutanoate/2-iminopropanoate deaminase
MAARRASIHVDGLSHGGQPIPNASRIGNLIWSGGVNGLKPGENALPDDIAVEASQMFANVGAIVGAGGGTLDDVIRVSVFVRDRAEARDAINAAWVQAFPDDESRPARHLIEQSLQGGMKVQCEFIAVLDGPS